MPKTMEMTWNRKMERWFKKSGGKQYTVGCKLLGKLYPQLYRGATQELSTDREITSGFRFEKGYNEGMAFFHPVTPSAGN
jgi:hypothetical protein